MHAFINFAPLPPLCIHKKPTTITYYYSKCDIRVLMYLYQISVSSHQAIVP